MMINCFQLCENDSVFCASEFYFNFFFTLDFIASRNLKYHKSFSATRKVFTSFE